MKLRIDEALVDLILQTTGTEPCVVGDPVLWQSTEPVDIAYAKSECAECFIRFDCLNYALTRDETGVWGGLTQEERTALKEGIVA